MAPPDKISVNGLPGKDSGRGFGMSLCLRNTISGHTLGPVELTRRQVFFSGSVQGVGFRYTTQWVADRFPVAGFVQNLSDGRVELVAEGHPEQVDAFVAAVEEVMTGHIRHMERIELPATGEFDGFRVRR